MDLFLSHLFLLITLLTAYLLKNLDLRKYETHKTYWDIDICFEKCLINTKKIEIRKSDQHKL